MCFISCLLPRLKVIRISVRYISGVLDIISAINIVTKMPTVLECNNTLALADKKPSILYSNVMIRFLGSLLISK